jgi:uncharacterized protein with HEPN domain
MRPYERNAAYLWDMLDAALAIREFTSEMSYGQYIQDMKTRMAVERALEIIGEAARNKHERIWIVVTEHIPDLINKLEPLIPPVPPDGP